MRPRALTQLKKPNVVYWEWEALVPEVPDSSAQGRLNWRF